MSESQAGKGDARRGEYVPGSYGTGYGAIDWTKLGAFDAMKESTLMWLNEESEKTEELTEARFQEIKAKFK